MKILFFFLSAIVLLASCTGGIIDGYTPSNQGKWVVVTDSSGCAIGTKEIFPDTTAAVRVYFSQKVKIAAHHGGLGVFIAFSILGVLLLAFGFWQTTRPQRNDYLNLLWPILALICGIIAFGSIEWARGKDVLIPKKTYDSVIVNHGDLKAVLEPYIYQ